MKTQSGNVAKKICVCVFKLIPTATEISVKSVTEVGNKSCKFLLNPHFLSHSSTIFSPTSHPNYFSPAPAEVETSNSPQLHSSSHSPQASRTLTLILSQFRRTTITCFDSSFIRKSLHSSAT